MTGAGPCVDKIAPDTARALIEKYHYLGSKPFRQSFCFGLFLDDVVVGAIVYHGLSAPETAVGAFGLGRNDQGGLFEIGRLVLTPDNNGKNFGSMLVGRSIRLLRKATQVRAIITYAEAGLHNGSIYQACNFIYCGLAAAKCDYVLHGKVKERGPTKAMWFGEAQDLGGEWRPRPRKHRYVMVFDKALVLKWRTEPYPKANPRRGPATCANHNNLVELAAKEESKEESRELSQEEGTIIAENTIEEKVE